MNEPLAPELEALVLAELSKRVKSRTDLVKATVGQRYPDGHKETFRSPLDGSKLGIVYRTDPDPVWRITDPEELDRFLVDEDLGNVETVYEITADYAELVPVLLEHAPHLVEQVKRVTQEARDWAMDTAKAGAAVPGVTKVKPPGSLTVKPDPKAGVVVESLVEAGVITWDGRPVLEAGQEAS